jgi:hypothetical protein
MGLGDILSAAAGAPRREPHTLPGGQIVYVGEVGTDEWLEIEAETMDWCQRHGKLVDPYLDARLVIRSVTDADNKLLSPRFTPSGDPDKDRPALEAYEAELVKITRSVRRVGHPLLRLVNRVNFATDAELAALKKKSDGETSAGSSSSATAPDSSISEPPPDKSAA